jgi:AbiV family abortive infection protein
MPKQTSISLTFEQLLDAYTKSIDNAMRLHSAGVCLLKEHPEICLGLFELGQEELGKSYSCLAAMGVKEDAKEFWKSFWEEWKNHEIKAHRAFYYEPHESALLQYSFSAPNGVMKIRKIAFLSMPRTMIRCRLPGASSLGPPAMPEPYKGRSGNGGHPILFLSREKVRKK